MQSAHNRIVSQFEHEFVTMFRWFFVYDTVDYVGNSILFISLDVASLKPIAFALTLRALLSMLFLPFDDFLSSNKSSSL